MPASSAAAVAALIASAMSERSCASSFVMITRSMCSRLRLTGSRWTSRGFTSTVLPSKLTDSTTRGLRRARLRSCSGRATWTSSVPEP